LIVSQTPASAAGVFTQNQIVAAPIIISKKHIENGIAQAIVATSGNANACTGEEGLKAAEAMANIMADELEILNENVIVASTGIIGETYPIDKVVKGIKKNIRNLSNRQIAGAMAANAIMTTDTFQKDAYITFRLGKSKINLAGIAKGAGMIHPNMATMLAFFACDADIEPELLNQALRCAVAKSFNMISVDGDTSTNDMVVILSNGQAGNKRIVDKDENYRKFKNKLKILCRVLAKAIISDGEGATKFIEYRVKNSKTVRDAKRIVRTISNSNLVKTALFGRDPNWGRIIAAVGCAGVDINPYNIDIYIGSRKIVKVAESGNFIDFNKKQLKLMLKSSRIKIIVDLNDGDAQAVGWGCDLSYNYIRINSEYTT
jgi:glutamate N-acetyltransferase/amino-acid N-acetyltransferase